MNLIQFVRDRSSHSRGPFPPDGDRSDLPENRDGCGPVNGSVFRKREKCGASSRRTTGRRRGRESLRQGGGTGRRPNAIAAAGGGSRVRPALRRAPSRPAGPGASPQGMRSFRCAENGGGGTPGGGEREATIP